MADLPTRDELRTLVIAAAWNDVFLPDGAADRILDAILPLVMRGPVEALGPPACKCGAVDAFDHSRACADEWLRWDKTKESRARTVRQWAENIGGG